MFQFLADSGCSWCRPPKTSVPVPDPPWSEMPPRNWPAAEQVGFNTAAAVFGGAGCPTTGQVGSVLPEAPPAVLTALTCTFVIGEISAKVGARNDVPMLARSR